MSRRLVEAIRGGAIIPEIVRRKACAGELPISLEEKIEILVFLAADRDQETRQSALSTLRTWPQEELQQVLSNPSASTAVLEFVAIEVAPGRKELWDALLRNPSLPLELREWLEHAAALFAQAEARESSEAPLPIQPADEEEPSSDKKGEQKRNTMLQRVDHMSILERTKAALNGTQEERLLLIRDSNKVVARAVLESPKLSDHEVENFAGMKDVDEDVLRLIAANRKFMKNYAVLRALVSNSRTPIPVGLSLLKRVNDRDLRLLVLNRNVAEPIRIAAKKRIALREEAKKVRFPGFS
jgi:hypothetical protein